MGDIIDDVLAALGKPREKPRPTTARDVVRAYLFFDMEDPNIPVLCAFLDRIAESRPYLLAELEDFLSEPRS